MLNVETIKTFLGVTGVAEDARLVDLEKVVVADLESWFGDRHLGESTEQVEILDGPPWRSPGLVGVEREPKIRLKTHSHIMDTISDWIFEYRPSIQSVWIVSVNQTTDSPPRDRFVIDPRDPFAFERESGYWEVGRRRNRVTYKSGYAEDKAPTRIMEMALRLIRLRFLPFAIRSLPAGIVSAMVAGTSVKLSSGGDFYAKALPDLMPEIKALRWDYRGGLAT